MKILSLALICLICGCGTLAPNERYRSYYASGIDKAVPQVKGSFLDEEHQTKHAAAAAYITGCTIRRIGLGKTADFIDLLSEAADSNIIIPVDRMRTFEQDTYTIKLSGTISRDMNAASIYILIEF